MIKVSEKTTAQHFLERGYQRVVVQQDVAGFVYPIHYHPFNLAIQVLNGSMHITTNNRRMIAQAGDHIQIPANQLHAIHVGPDGCMYIHAEKEPD